MHKSKVLIEYVAFKWIILKIFSTFQDTTALNKNECDFVYSNCV